jgi:hypothetical protein
MWTLAPDAFHALAACASAPSTAVPLASKYAISPCFHVCSPFRHAAGGAEQHRVEQDQHEQESEDGNARPSGAGDERHLRSARAGRFSG